MAVGFSNTNKPINPRGNDASPKGYNRAKLFSGKALSFDGVNDDIQVSAFSTTGSTRSLSYYFKSSVSDNERVFEINTGGNYFNSTIFNGKINTFDGVNGINTTKTFNDNKWHHVVIAHNGNNNAAIYVDGVSQELDASTFSVHDITNQTLYICSATGFQFYTGGFSNLRLFDVALTAAQVADLYNNPEKVVPTGVDNTALKLFLPMQEGAGTTAYDGSGNGNHGTISGATYTHGIGAPVSQTAVIDWNKGTNNLKKTDDYTNATYWSQARCIPTSSSIRVPNADEDSVLITETTATGTHGIYNNGPLTIAANDTYTMSVFAKAGTRNWLIIDHFTGVTNHNWFDLSTGSVGITGSGVNASIRDAGDGWYQCSVTRTTTGTAAIYIGVYLSTGDGVSSYLGASGTGYFYGLSITQGSNATYVPNPTTTSITSPVLLPQGLTTGRDITGVNLFENVRKQGALNLDGNSWAEVHDNASLDISPAMTMEAWFNCDDISSGSYETIFAKPSGTTWVYPYAYYNLRVISTNVQWWFEGTFYLAQYDVSLTGWNHLLVTKNGTSEILYINGVQVATHTGNAAISASPYDLILGANTDKMEKASSQIAQPRIYNRALTAAEVLQNYNSGKNTYK